MRQGEIQPDLKVTPFPEELREYQHAKKLWFDLQARTIGQGMWDSSNTEPLARYCIACEMLKQLAQSPELSDKSAEYMRWHTIAKQLEACFGFTPADRVGKQGFAGGEEKSKRANLKIFSA